MGSRRAVVYLILVFLLGLAAGALGDLWRQKGAQSHEHPEDEVQGAVRHLTQELDLTPEQQQQVEVILDETGQGYYGIYLRFRDEYDSIRQEGRKKIRALLTEEQLPKFEELVRRREETEKRTMERFEERRKAQEPSGEEE